MDNNYNNNEYQENSYNPAGAVSDVQVVTQKTYLYMFIALIISGICAYATYASGLIVSMVVSGSFYVCLILEIVAVIATTSLIKRDKTIPAAIGGIAYSILNGLTLSIIFVAYDMNSIISVFFITAGLFGIMSVYGTITKKDLTSVGSIALMALIGMILVTIVNMLILHSEGLDLALAYIGVIIFLAITAYDTQKIRKMTEEKALSENTIALYCAINLYLDFINLLLKLLRIFGKRN